MEKKELNYEDQKKKKDKTLFSYWFKKSKKFQTRGEYKKCYTLLTKKYHDNKKYLKPRDCLKVLRILLHASEKVLMNNFIQNKKQKEEKITFYEKLIEHHMEYQYDFISEALQIMEPNNQLRSIISALNSKTQCKILNQNDYLLKLLEKKISKTKFDGVDIYSDQQSIKFKQKYTQEECIILISKKENFYQSLIIISILKTMQLLVLNAKKYKDLNSLDVIINTINEMSSQYTNSQNADVLQQVCVSQLFYANYLVEYKQENPIPIYKQAMQISRKEYMIRFKIYSQTTGFIKILNYKLQRCVKNQILISSAIAAYYESQSNLKKMMESFQLIQWLIINYQENYLTDQIFVQSIFNQIKLKFQKYGQVLKELDFIQKNSKKIILADILAENGGQQMDIFIQNTNNQNLQFNSFQNHVYEKFKYQELSKKQFIINHTLDKVNQELQEEIRAEEQNDKQVIEQNYMNKKHFGPNKKSLNSTQVNNTDQTMDTNNLSKILNQSNDQQEKTIDSNNFSKILNQSVISKGKCITHRENQRFTISSKNSQEQLSLSKQNSVSKSSTTLELRKTSEQQKDVTIEKTLPKINEKPSRVLTTDQYFKPKPIPPPKERDLIQEEIDRQIALLAQYDKIAIQLKKDQGQKMDNWFFKLINNVQKKIKIEVPFEQAMQDCTNLLKQEEFDLDEFTNAHHFLETKQRLGGGNQPEGYEKPMQNIEIKLEPPTSFQRDQNNVYIEGNQHFAKFGCKNKLKELQKLLAEEKKKIQQRMWEHQQFLIMEAQFDEIQKKENVKFRIRADEMNKLSKKEHAELHKARREDSPENRKEFSDYYKADQENKSLIKQFQEFLFKKKEIVVKEESQIEISRRSVIEKEFSNLSQSIILDKKAKRRRLIIEAKEKNSTNQDQQQFNKDYVPESKLSPKISPKNKSQKSSFLIQI